jgi:cyanate permease
MIASQIGEAIGPVVTGYVFDVRGSYFVAFLIWAVLATVGLVMVLIFRTPRKPV